MSPKKRRPPSKRSKATHARASSPKTQTTAPATPRVGSPSVVVGIGASAGGLEALKVFFAAVPSDTGLAFVVVVHLDPTHDSLLPELLGRAISLPVLQAHDRQVIESNHVYIIPPNRHLTIDQGLIRITEPLDRRGLRGTIDHFFRSLAHDQHERAICIILSGTGTEGTLGAAAVKAEGGMVMAQAPETAAQPGMPGNAIATGHVDFILPPEDMPRALVNYTRHPYVHPQPAPPRDSVAKEAEALQSVIALVRGRTKVDFRGYKKGTLQRRVERRMGLQQIKSVRRYVEVLRGSPKEVDLLFKDLLISVTGFFRDSDAFDELSARVFAKLVVEDGYETPVRIWVPGCATGEEAYSLAILAAEQAAAVPSLRRVQIFATDVDETALESARAATYPESIALDVSPQRLSRFFTREDHHYRVAKSIREMVVFATQNLISDPPFSRLDLVCCRNVLIYLEPDVQRKLIALFHFALNSGGHLFLGSSETAGEGSDLFEPVSKRWRVFKRLGPSKRPAMDIPFPNIGSGRRDRVAIKTAPEATLASLAEHQLLAQMGLTAVVVNRLGQIMHFLGPMSRYLTLPNGAPTLDLATLAREPLKPILRAALHDAVRRRRRVALETALTGTRKPGGTLRITVSPVRAGDEQGLSLVVFEEIPPPAGGSLARTQGKQHRDIVHRLEAELKLTKREQQSLVVELESSNEDLKAANEEVTSMNEELQSTNEELESSKEELQSMNEELSTVNSQLQEKVQELTALNDDLNNVFAATDIATVFVDADFRVTRFTEAATRLLNLIASDIGRPIAHLANNLIDFELAVEAESVLRTRAPIEKAVQARDGRHYIVRVLPYWKEGKVAQGVVVTLTDVTALKTSENELRLLNQTLEERIRDRTRHVLLLHDVARIVSEASSWDDALHSVLRRLCIAEKWQIGYIYLPAEGAPGDLTPAIAYVAGDAFQPFHQRTLRRFGRGEGLAGRAYLDGEPIWLSDQAAIVESLSIRGSIIKQLELQTGVAVPLSLGGETIGVLELFSTVARPASTELTHLLTDVGVQITGVIDRERTMSQAAALVWREQQNLVHNLHDSLGQQLTGIALLSSGLRKRIGNGQGDIGEIVNQVADQAQASVEQVRQLSSGLFPVEIESDGLVHALQRLATTTSNLAGVPCTVETMGTVNVADNRVATELYRVAQEAVTNALKHAEATGIVVRLVAEPGATILSVTDDGRGVQQPQPDGQGVGLRIMRYRAQSIGASLIVESVPDEGTKIVCLLRDAPTPKSTQFEE